MKLKAEAAAPFRLFRSFVYVTLGAAAGLGTLTTVPQLIHQLAEHANPTSTLTNLAINTGGLLITGYLLSKEATNEKRLRKNLSSTQALSENKLNPTEIRTREELLLLLPVEIQVSETNENTTRIFPLYDLVNQGKQHIVIVAGGSSFVRDAIIAARLMDESTFSSNEIMIIPYINDINLMNDKTNNKGVGTVKDPLMSEPLFAKPQQVLITSEYSCKLGLSKV